MREEQFCWYLESIVKYTQIEDILTKDLQKIVVVLIKITDPTQLNVPGAVTEAPRRSSYEVRRQLETIQSSVRRILRRTKVQLYQMEVPQWMTRNIYFLKFVLFTDQCTFQK